MPSNIVKANILVVDDVRYTHLLIEDILKKNGYNNISHVMSGQECMDKLLKSPLPDLILLDLILPDTDGFEICKFLKSNPKTSKIPIIVQSSITKPEQKKIAFELGANDFVHKPIEPIELISRVKLQLEQQQLHSCLVEANARMKNEIEDAEELLSSFLPKNNEIEDISKQHKISIASYYKPSSELGGDFYNLSNSSDQKISFYLWDFSGHGIRAAINTIRLYSLLNENITSNEELTVLPGKLLSIANSLLLNFNSRQYYATMFYGVIDCANKVLDYSFASCPWPILISFKNKSFKLIDTTEFPLGVQEHCYSNYRISLKDWDMIISYSDALIETSDSQYKFLTPENIANLAFSCSNSNETPDAETVKNAILSHFNKECADRLCDDLTLLIIGFTN